MLYDLLLLHFGIGFDIDDEQVASCFQHHFQNHNIAFKLLDTWNGAFEKRRRYLELHHIGKKEKKNCQVSLGSHAFCAFFSLAGSA